MPLLLLLCTIFFFSCVLGAGALVGGCGPRNRGKVRGERSAAGPGGKGGAGRQGGSAMLFDAFGRSWMF